MPFQNTNLDPDSQVKLQSITTLFNSLDGVLNAHTDCREKLYVLYNLEQAFMWWIRLLEREQFEKNYKISIRPELSPNASVLAESRKTLDSLKDSIQELTQTVATTGLPIFK